MFTVCEILEYVYNLNYFLVKRMTQQLRAVVAGPFRPARSLVPLAAAAAWERKTAQADRPSTRSSTNPASRRCVRASRV